MDARTVAVVVTFNRWPLAERVVRAIDESQSPVDEIIVVDNASSDGTADRLEALTLSAPLSIVRMTENTGGAGGFKKGIATALDRGADRIWLMDDDGVPAPDVLGMLLPMLRTHEFVGPAVVTEDDPDQLCFPIRVPGTARTLRTVGALEAATTDGVLEGAVIPFNGVLVTRGLVERIGLPREEFFIWGDDVEYLWRAKKAGARVATVAAARFSHPSIGDLGTPMMFGRTTYNHSSSELKHYCMVRNNITNLRAYVGVLGVAAFLVKTVWFYTFTRPSLSRLRLSLSAAIAAFRKDFTGHRRFLK